MSQVKVVLGVCQTDFYNAKLFEGVADGKHKGISIFRCGKVEYVGVEVQLVDNKATFETIEDAYQNYRDHSFGSLKRCEPKIYQLGVGVKDVQ